jgi:hypothetical protein
MNKPDRAAALRLPPRRSARVPPGARELPCLRAQGDCSECGVAATAARLYAPDIAGAAVTLPEVPRARQGLARCGFPAKGLNT